MLRRAQARPNRRRQGLHVWIVSSSLSSTLQAAETATSADLQLACPICHEPFAGNAYSCRCERCRSSFTASGPYLDLTIGSTVGTGAYRDQPWAGTQIFRSPLVSFAYERGWRQSFAWAGFPGVKEEARIALEFLRPAWGSPVVDMSCGSGLFTRELIASAKFPRVVAADFSESMLRQADEYLAAMGTESRGEGGPERGRVHGNCSA